MTDAMDMQAEQTAPTPTESTQSQEALMTEPQAVMPADQPEGAPNQAAAEPAPELSTEVVGATVAETPVETNAEKPAAASDNKAKPSPKRGKASDKGKDTKDAKNPKKGRQGSTRSVGFIALPVGVSQLIKKYGVTHPGLVLNKYAVLLKLQDRRLQYDFSSEQKKRILQKVAHLLNSEPELKNVWEKQLAQRNALLADAKKLSFTSLSPTLFESYHPFATLGVELHQLYGFPVIAAEQLKGALKHYVLSQWLPQQSDKVAAQAQLNQVFGSSDEADILFHDLWPESWPSLAVEQIANHHPAYYGRREYAGDWQTPETESFLVLKPGSRFQIAYSLRRPDVAPALTQQLESWIHEFLQIQGLGAYRQWGYGRWKGAQHVASSDWEAVLTLSTPAFLAGATQRPEDCRLRMSHLRGLLRWWWRSLYSGYLSHRELGALEAVLWGAPGRKGAVRLALQPEKDVQARRYRPEEILQRLPQAEGPRRSPGLVYLGYGFFSEHAKRYFIDQGASWNLSVQVEEALWQRKEGDVHLSKALILQQVQAAIWLLAQFGGVGQRKRKGFGALALKSDLDLNLEQCQTWAAEMRTHCALPEQFSADLAVSPALSQALDVVEIQTPWKNTWFALHQLGESLQSFMQAHKHEAQKSALGLPRVMAPPVNGEFKTPEAVTQRHAAPYFLKLEPQAQGITLRFLALPAAYLPNLSDSQAMLQALFQHLAQDIPNRVQQWPTEPKIEAAQPGTSERPRRPRPHRAEAADNRERRPFKKERPERGDRPPRGGDKPQRERRPQRPRGEDKQWPPGGERRKSTGRTPERKRPSNGLPQAGDWITAKLLEERTKKGGWRAVHEKSRLNGPLVNTGMVPGEQEPGNEVELIVHAANKLEMMFRWPTEADREKRNNPKAASKKKH